MENWADDAIREMFDTVRQERDSARREAERLHAENEQLRANYKSHVGGLKEGLIGWQTLADDLATKLIAIWEGDGENDPTEGEIEESIARYREARGQ